MMPRRMAGMSLALLVALAGCEGGQQASEESRTIKVTASSEYIDKLKALSPLNQGLALRRAIQDSGQSCRRVEGAAYQEDYKNLSMWTATCSGGKNWAVFIAPNGDVQVRPCADAETLGLPACRIGDGDTAR